jgi:hypothetical protein
MGRRGREEEERTYHEYLISIGRKPTDVGQ